MTNKEKEKLIEDLEVMKTNELIDIIIDQEERLEIYEEKERENIKQGKAEIWLIIITLLGVGYFIAFIIIALLGIMATID